MPRGTDRPATLPSAYVIQTASFKLLGGTPVGRWLNHELRLA